MALVVWAGGAIAAGDQEPKGETDQGASASTARTSSAKRLEKAEVLVEINETDGDAGLQVFLDGRPWRAVTIYGPNGNDILAYQTRSKIRDFGMTELFSESSEPPFTRFPLDEFKALFPEGEYRFVGRSIDGARMVATATLSHAFPNAPEIVEPADGTAVSSDGTVIRWKPVPQPAGVEIVGYQVTLEREDPLRIFSVDLPADARRIRIPGVYLEPGVEYSAEVLAIDASGNRTLTSITLSTG
jgi:hypothetical protein